MSVAPAEGDGWSLRPLRLFPDERGAVLHMLRASDAHFERFGEIYFSTIRQGVVKAWHLHRTKTINLAVPIGAVRVVVWREGGTAQELTLGREAYGLLTIRPGVWYGFEGLGAGESLIANCATEPYDAAEGEDLPPDSARVPYRWPLL
ncbi:WxcM-like domain-containing protein [Segnochrobactrum spirostomi]|uniref:dTDP-4-dehydrorhamnose 3,5-epimerase n=1 Tax=Segnochrobactrum spirostomi TaxID=2608987 RepID=A0A6A7Y437_9HYPH|nr:WxcM-like domain-containing protein [Segnochrobactrum spirostomi]MQT13485.1 dTDP-4-dehydrorhamnose 3,5-epimerase [Segnochrobactrum spirostomi]